ncbi:hypothetical protein V3N99_06515 [Dermatophilaceae bacterium Soc4.6]
MVIDVRRGVELGVQDELALVAVPTPKPPPGTAFPPRRLTLRGVPVFELALWCGTCPAIFQRLSEPENAELGLVNARLNTGLHDIDDEVLRVYGQALPASRYTAILLEVVPELVTPGDPSDYFSHEQVATWGVDPVLGVPESPGSLYYRTFETPMGNQAHLYEFVVPMVPPAWNESGRLAAYGASGATLPTAVAYSLLDVVQPAMEEGDDYYEHWVLSHFLLDGHHKIEAASAAGRPVRLLSLIDERISIGSPEDIATAVKARSNARQARG